MGFRVQGLRGQMLMGKTLKLWHRCVVMAVALVLEQYETGFGGKKKLQIEALHDGKYGYFLRPSAGKATPGRNPKPLNP